MTSYKGSFAKLLIELTKLPTIGPKTAQRLAYHILKISTEDAGRLANAIIEVKEKVGQCSQCFMLTETEPCEICTGKIRDKTKICVVEQPQPIRHRPADQNRPGLHPSLGLRP